MIYTWWAQRRGFIRNTLKAEKCDVVMGVPAELDLVETTRPYYRSSYVFISRSDRAYAMHSTQTTPCQTARSASNWSAITKTTPARACSARGLVDNVVGYTLSRRLPGRQSPKRIVEAVKSGVVDVAAVWGPLAGYYAQRSRVPLTLTPIGDTAGFAPGIRVRHCRRRSQGRARAQGSDRGCARPPFGGNRDSCSQTTACRSSAATRGARPSSVTGEEGVDVPTEAFRRGAADLPVLGILALTLAAPAEAQQSTDGLSSQRPCWTFLAPAAGDATAADQNELLRVPVSGLVPGAHAVRPNIENPKVRFMSRRNVG